MCNIVRITSTTSGCDVENERSRTLTVHIRVLFHFPSDGAAQDIAVISRDFTPYNAASVLSSRLLDRVRNGVTTGPGLVVSVEHSVVCRLLLLVCDQEYIYMSPIASFCVCVCVCAYVSMCVRVRVFYHTVTC